MKRTTTRVIKSRPDSEHAEQVMLVKHLTPFYPSILFAAIPNGAHLKGGGRTCNKLKAEGLKPGAPDVIVWSERGEVQIELKRTDCRTAKNGGCSDEQIEFRKRIEEFELNHITYRVAYGYHDAIAILRSLGYDV